MARPGFQKRLRDCLASEELEEKLNDFLSRNARRALQRSDLAEQKDDSAPIEGEFSLEAYDLWKKYLAVIEDVIETFQRDEGLSQLEFRRAVEDVDERNSFLIRLMIASWEFEQFIDMCREYVNNNEDAGESKGEGKVRRRYFY
jgi:hypothetical protein